LAIAPRCKTGGHPYRRGEEIITVEVKQNNKDILLQLLQKHWELGVSSQIDYDKFYLYSIITHSTAIEGSTVTEVEAQLLFDEGITSSKRTMMEQMMNLDLKNAYDFGRDWIKQHLPITVDWLILLASKVMARTGSEYNAVGGSFSAAKGELRMLNVTAGLGGKSYMSYLKVPAKLQAFCDELNRRRAAVDPTDVYAIYELSYWAHFELVTIHPWADGNGRTSRLLMNLLQMEWGLLPSKVLKQDKAMYIQALIDTREQEDIDIFIQCMHHLHCEHVQHDIDQFLQSSENGYVEKNEKYVVKEPKRVGKTSEKIIAAMRMNPEVTEEFLASDLHLSLRGIEDNIARLKKAGRIVRHGGRKKGYWEIL